MILQLGLLRVIPWMGNCVKSALMATTKMPALAKRFGQLTKRLNRNGKRYTAA